MQTPANSVCVSVPVHHVRVTRPSGPGERIVFSSALAKNQVSSVDSVAKTITEINSRGNVRATWHSEPKSNSGSSGGDETGDQIGRGVGIDSEFQQSYDYTLRGSRYNSNHRYDNHNHSRSHNQHHHHQHKSKYNPYSSEDSRFGPCESRLYTPTVTLEGPEHDVYTERAFLMENYWMPTSAQVPVPSAAASKLSEWCKMLDGVAAYCDVSIFVCACTGDEGGSKLLKETTSSSQNNGGGGGGGGSIAHASATGRNAHAHASTSANGTVRASASAGGPSSGSSNSSSSNGNKSGSGGGGGGGISGSRGDERVRASVSTSPSPSSHKNNNSYQRLQNVLVVHIQGHTDNVSYATTQIKIVLDHVCGLFVDAVSIPRSMLPALACEDSANFNELEARTGVSLYMFDWVYGWMGGAAAPSVNMAATAGLSGMAGGAAGVAGGLDSGLVGVGATSSTCHSHGNGNIGSKSTSTTRNTTTALGITNRPEDLGTGNLANGGERVMPAPIAQLSPYDMLYITGSQPNVALARAILAEIISKCDLYAHVIHLSCAKIDMLTLTYRDRLRDLMLKHGSFIELPSAGSCGTAIRVVGGCSTAVHETINEIMGMAQSLYEAELVVDPENGAAGLDDGADLPDHTSKTSSQRRFSKFIPAPSSIAAWAGQSGAIVSLEGLNPGPRTTIRVLGTQASVKYCVFDLIANQCSLSSIAFRVELCSSHKEFVAGRKNGKLARIMKSSGVVVDFAPVTSSHGVYVRLVSTDCGRASQGLRLLEQELPAQISFYVPEAFHRQIIGSGGARVQAIMRKHNVFVKFGVPTAVPSSGRSSTANAHSTSSNASSAFSSTQSQSTSAASSFDKLSPPSSLGPGSFGMTGGASSSSSNILSSACTPSNSNGSGSSSRNYPYVSTSVLGPNITNSNNIDSSSSGTNSNDNSPAPSGGSSPPESEYGSSASGSSVSNVNSSGSDATSNTTNSSATISTRGSILRNAIYCSRRDNVVIRCPARNYKSLERAKQDILEMAAQCDQSQDAALVYISRAQRRILLDHRAGIIERIEQKTSSVILFDNGDFDRNGQLVQVKAQPASSAAEAARILASQLPREFVFRIAYSLRFDGCVDERAGDFFSRIVVTFRIALRIEVQVRSADDGGHSIYLAYSPEDASGLDHAVQALTAFLRERQLNIIYKGEHVVDSQVR